jgi:hypothetical protein
MKTTYPLSIVFALILALLGFSVASAQSPVGTSFTYQGTLLDGDEPASGNYDFQFTLHDAATAGNVVGTTIAKDNVAVSGGVFTVVLDFGAVFDGNKRFVEVAVRPHGGGDFTVLTPRQEITAVPYALFALNGVVGPQGPQGPQGITGTAGITGATGITGPQGIQGPKGITGTAGLACWDLNGNGIGDPEEDLNGDTHFTADDCRGPAGTDGVDGHDGVDGLNGIDGLDGPPGPVGFSSTITNTAQTRDLATNNGLTFRMTCTTSGANTVLTLQALFTGTGTAYQGVTNALLTSTPSTIYVLTSSGANANVTSAQAVSTGGAANSNITATELQLIDDGGFFLALSRETLMFAVNMTDPGTCTVAGVVAKN